MILEFISIDISLLTERSVRERSEFRHKALLNEAANRTQLSFILAFSQAL